MNELSNLKAPEGSTRKRNRVGRGPGSGNGKTCGKGHKGQKSRAGGGVPIGFEGGQMPAYRRLPKYGFKNRFRTSYDVVNVSDLARFEAGTTVTIADLVAARLVRKGSLVKLLGNGELAHAVTVHAHKASKSAEEKMAKAGGGVVLDAPNAAATTNDAGDGAQGSDA